MAGYIVHYIYSVSSNILHCIAFSLILPFCCSFLFIVLIYCNALPCVYSNLYKKICHCFCIYLPFNFIVFCIYALPLFHCIANSVILKPALFFSHSFVFCIDALPISAFCIIFQMLLFSNYYIFFVFFLPFV